VAAFGWGRTRRLADVKYGIRMHWGDCPVRDLIASKWMLKTDFEGKQVYQKLYKQFNPKDFDAEDWMQMLLVASVFRVARIGISLIAANSFLSMQD